MKKVVLKMFMIILAMFIVMILLNKYVLINVHVPTGSMENTIYIGDKLIGSRLSYQLSDIDRYDIVIADDPFKEDRLIVKRVIGLPREKVEIRDGKIYINGNSESMAENYLKEEWTENNDKYCYEIPENSYLLLGDNRNDSFDARDWSEKAEEEKRENPEQYSYVNKEHIIAKVIFRYSPEFQILG